MKNKILYALATLGVILLAIVIASTIFRANGSSMMLSDGSEPHAEYAQAVDGFERSSRDQPQRLRKMASAEMSAMISKSPQSPADNSQSEALIKRMIIRNADLSLQTKNINDAIDEISHLADSSGGYVVSSSVSNTDKYSNYSYGDITIRVPAEGLQTILTQLKTLSTQVISEKVSGEDITQQYVDLQSTLANLEASKVQLTKIMADAKKTEDVLNVYRELTNIQERINVTQGRIKYYNEATALSRINVHLVTKPTIKENIGNWQLWDATKQSFNALTGKLESLSYSMIYFVIYYVPLLIIWGAILLLCYAVGIRIYRRFIK
tara:strand:+ start:1028 stop:1993 length:966 start_codon:yes stop_codon:yes gene_type:complete